MTAPLVLKRSVAGDRDPALYTGAAYEEIDLTGSSELSARGLRALNADRLRVAIFTACESIDDEALRVIASWPVLETLDLTGCDAITDAGVAALGRRTSLRSLNLTWCYGVGDAALPPLQSVHLRRLNLTSCNVTEKGVDALSRFEHLEWLALPLFAAVGDAAIQRLAATASPIRTLVFGGDVTPRSLGALAKLRTLEKIGLGGRDRSYPDEAFVEAIPPGVKLTFL